MKSFSHIISRISSRAYSRKKISVYYGSSFKIIFPNLNLKTNAEYKSDEEAESDVNNPGTDTKQEDISRSVNIKVAKLPDVISKSEDE